MNIKKKTIILTLLLTLCLTTLLGCSSNQENNSDAENKTIKIGCMTTSEPILKLAAAGLKDKGYTIESVLFDENNMPCTALMDGDVDGVVLNHKAWLDTFNKENGSDLSMAEPYWYYSPFRLYSVKYDSPKALPDGASIVVPSDSTNMERSLILLQAVGLIELGEKNNAFYTPVDIVKNPKNIQLITAEITTAANSINDADAVISPAVYIAQEGTLNPEEFLYDDPDSESDYPLGLIVQTDDLNSEWIKALSEYMSTDEAKELFDAEYNGSYVYIAK